jgi:hypothetical protein
MNLGNPLAPCSFSRTSKPDAMPLVYFSGLFSSSFDIISPHAVSRIPKPGYCLEKSIMINEELITAIGCHYLPALVRKMP